MKPINNVLGPARGAVRSNVLGLLIAATSIAAVPASAQWGPVSEVAPKPVFAVVAKGDTIVAGADTSVYVSTNAGATWRQSTRPAAGVLSIQAVLVRNGRLYAGTFGQGVHVSDDLGATWHPFNEGLVGGFLDSQLDVTDLADRGDSLFVGTAGASVYMRPLDVAGAWQPFGTALEPNQASNVNAFLLVGGRLLALAGDNGMVFRNDPGESDWTVSNLDNIGVHAGLQASTGVFTGTAWVIGSNSGVFRSTAGQEPWTRTALAIGAVSWTALAVKDGRVYGAFNLSSDAVIGESVDNGATWQNAEVQQNVFVQKMAISGGELYAARNDGLWRRPLTVTAVTPGGGTNPLRFAVAGPQPFGSGTRVRFELPSAGSVSIELFDVQGRLVGDRIERSLSAGKHDMAIDGGRLGSGVYMARLTAGGSQQVVRLVHVK